MGKKSAVVKMQKLVSLGSLVPQYVLREPTTRLYVVNPHNVRVSTGMKYRGEKSIC